jgi:hypothetical protein
VHGLEKSEKMGSLVSKSCDAGGRTLVAVLMASSGKEINGCGTICVVSSSERSLRHFYYVDAFMCRPQTLAARDERRAYSHSVSSR